MARIYVTYRHNDLELARKLVDALRRRGRHHVTIDVDHLVLGQEWRRALDDAFRAADGLVVLLTENSVDAKEGHIASHYIAADIGRAMASGKVVMPIILKPARIPDLVRDIHCEFMKEQKDAYISSMVEKIEQGLEKHRSSVGHESQSLVPEGFRHLTENVRNFYEDECVLWTVNVGGINAIPRAVAVGGAGSRWPATREITSFWYPVWLTYPAGLIKDSRLLDAPSHGVSPQETIRIARDYDFLVLFTSTPGFANDVRLAEMVKAVHPTIQIAFVGPHVSVSPEESLRSSTAIDFVVYGGNLNLR